MTVDAGAHVWDLARLAWALHGTVTTTTVPIGEFTGSDSGSVVVWDSDAASRLFQCAGHRCGGAADVLEAGQGATAVSHSKQQGRVVARRHAVRECLL